MNLRNPSNKRGFTIIELLVVTSVAVVSLALAMPAMQKSRQVARNVECANRLKSIGLAMHNYHDTYNTLPPGWVSRRPTGEGHPSTGWSTSILPFLEQAALYNELNVVGSVYEPRQASGVSADRQNALLKRSLPQYRCVAEPEGDTNPLRGDWGISNFSGNYGSKPIARWSGLSFFPGQVATRGADKVTQPDGLFFVNSRIGFRDITDGTSNTLMVGERSIIGRGGIWPGPRSNFEESDVVSDGSFASVLNGSDTGFSSRHNQGIHFVICDGSVRFIRANIDSLPKGGTLQKLCGRNDGQVIGEF
jgi:prepilin-type N-terminal cleavage/methylation domain-containing protein